MKILNSGSEIEQNPAICYLHGTMHAGITHNLVSAWMILGFSAGFCLGILYLFRPYGNQKSNHCYAVLCLAFSLSLLNNFLAHRSGPDSTLNWLFLPLWYPLLFGPLIFYYVKFRLYPAYRFRFSDLKHLLLPILQASFYWIVFLQDPERKLEIYQQLYLPWFKPLEGGLFILSFFGYLIMAYRYLKYREATLRRNGYEWRRRKVRWLKVHLRVLFLLAALNTFYILADFVAFNFFRVNLYDLPGYAYLSDLSFAAILLWLAGKAWQWGYGPGLAGHMAPPAKESLDATITFEKRFLDPDLRPMHLARARQTPIRQVRAEIVDTFGQSFPEWLGNYRRKEMEKRREIPMFQKYHPLSLALLCGFPSGKAYERQIQKTTT